MGIGERKVFGGGQSQQMDNVLAMRQFCIFYHYYLVELFVQYSYVKMSLGQVEVLLRLYYSLSLLIKYKSTYCISIMSIHYKYYPHHLGTTRPSNKYTNAPNWSTRPMR